jgi:polysaccharide export outer membrane protein
MSGSSPLGGRDNDAAATILAPVPLVRGVAPQPEGVSVSKMKPATEAQVASLDQPSAWQPVQSLEPVQRVAYNETLPPPTAQPGDRSQTDANLVDRIYQDRQQRRQATYGLLPAPRQQRDDAKGQTQLPPPKEMPKEKPKGVRGLFSQLGKDGDPSKGKEKDKDKDSSQKDTAKDGNGKADAKKDKGPPRGYPVLPPPYVSNPPIAPRGFAKQAYSMYIIEPPDVLVIEASAPVGDPEGKQPISGMHLVKQDGTILLGTYGSIAVAGLTLDEAKYRIIEKIRERQKTDPGVLWDAVKVDVQAFNSKWYYVITDGGGYGEQVFRFACTGNEQVLDAISQIQGLPAVAEKKEIWVARATPGHKPPYILPVDWDDIAKCGGEDTNYQLFPGDRIYVNSDKRIRVDSSLAKWFSPLERIFGITLLASSTVNSIKGQQAGGGGGIR